MGFKRGDANSYSEGATLYDGGREKVYIEPGVAWYFSSSMYMTGKLRFSYIEDKEDNFSENVSKYSLFNIDAGLVYSF